MLNMMNQRINYIFLNIYLQHQTGDLDRSQKVQDHKKILIRIAPKFEPLSPNR